MTDSAPFSRSVRVDAIPRDDGQTLVIEASPAERRALASSLGLPAIAVLTAALRLDRAGRGGARVSGTVHGELTQVCVVSLEPFAATVDEAVDVRFAPQTEEDRGRRPPRETETLSMAEDDGPEQVIDGRIDVGALAAEFFALGLDPYPRKPGVSFEKPADESEPDTPFSVLRNVQGGGSS